MEDMSLENVGKRKLEIEDISDHESITSSNITAEQIEFILAENERLKSELGKSSKRSVIY